MRASEIADRIGHKSKLKPGTNLTEVYCPVCQPDGPNRKGSPHAIVWDEGGYSHIKCTIRGCAEDDILRALKMSHADRKHESPNPTRTVAPVAAAVAYKPETYDNGLAVLDQAEDTYIYQDENGKTAYHKFRFKKRDGTKGFGFGQVNCKVVYKGTRDIYGQEIPRYLFNLPEVKRAIRDGLTIYLNEGEKATKAFISRGYVGTCTDTGANRWIDEYTEQLRGAKMVVIVADPDEAGMRWAMMVASALRTARIPCTVVQSATDGPKDDAYDHLEAGYTVDQFIPRRDLMPSRGFKSIQFDDTFKPVTLEHLVDPYLPRGKCVLLDADGGTGKTCMAAAWAAHLSQGRHPVTHEIIGDPVNILYLHRGEDQNEEIHTVFLANGGDYKRMLYPPIEIQDRLQFDPDGLTMLEETIEDEQISLVIVDALFYFIEKVIKDSNASLDVSGVMRLMNRVAERTGATFLNIRHTVKGAVGVAASNLGMGSAAFRNSHRGQLLARWHPEKRGVVVVEDHKGSLLNRRGDPFMFRRVELEVEYIWNEANPFDPTYEPKRPHEFGGASQEAKAFVLAYLESGARLSDDMKSDAIKAGIKDGTLRAAKKALTAEGLMKAYRHPLTPSGVWYNVLTREGPKPYNPFEDF